MLMTSFWCFYFYRWTYFTPCSSVSIVNFEQVNAGWARTQRHHFRNILPYNKLYDYLRFCFVHDFCYWLILYFMRMVTINGKESALWVPSLPLPYYNVYCCYPVPKRLYTFFICFGDFPAKFWDCYQTLSQIIDQRLEVSQPAFVLGQ